MNEQEMRAAFNEWMRRYTDEPERFEREFRTVAEFLAEAANGEEPSYGRSSAAWMLKLDAELSTKTGEAANFPYFPGETVTFKEKSNSGVMEWVDADAAFERINTACFMARWPNEDGSYQVAYCCCDEDANLYALDEAPAGPIWRRVEDAPEYLVAARIPEFA